MQNDHGSGPLPYRSLGPRNALLLATVSLVLLVPATWITFIDRDEGWYAQVVREMLQTGNWLVPHYLGEVWIGKPPLLYWLVGLSTRLFGFGEWQARLVSVLATSANCLLVGAIGAHLYSRRIGTWAAVVFVTFSLVAVTGKMLLSDPILLTCVLTSALMHLQMVTHGVSYPRALVHGLFIGLGALTKGPVILIFLGALWLATLIVYADRRRCWLGNWRWWASGVLALGVAVPWYIFIWLQTGPQFVDQFLWFEVLSRVAGRPHGGVPGFPGMYLLFSILGLLPWTGCAVMAVHAAFRRRREDSAAQLLLIWLAIPWAFLECLRNNPPHYIVPCYVPLAILLAAEIERLASTTQGWFGLTSARRWAFRVSWGAMLFLGAGVLLLGAAHHHTATGRAAIGLGAVVLVGFSAAGYLARRNLAAGCAGMVAAAVALHVVLGAILLPTLEPHRFSRKLADTINALARPGDQILLVGYKEPTLYVYLDLPARTIDSSLLGDILAARPPKQPLVLAIRHPELEGLNLRRLQTLLARSTRREVEGVNYVKRMQKVEVLVARYEPSKR